MPVSRLLLEPLARVALVDPRGLGELGRGQRSAVRERPVQPEPIADVDGEEIERPTASMNRRSTRRHAARLLRQLVRCAPPDGRGDLRPLRAEKAKGVDSRRWRPTGSGLDDVRAERRAVRPARHRRHRPRGHPRRGRAALGRRRPRVPRLRRRHRLPEPRARPGGVVRAVHEQVDRYLHQCFMVGVYEPYVEVCRRLDELWPGEAATKSILVNSRRRGDRERGEDRARRDGTARRSSSSTAPSTAARC